MSEKMPSKAAWHFFVNISYIRTLFIIILPFSWLVSNHTYPWTSAHSEVVAFLALFAFIMLSANRPVYITGWIVPVAVAVAIICLQFFVGIIDFRGDFVLSLTYIAAFYLSVMAGQLMYVEEGPSKVKKDLTVFCSSVLFASVISVLIASCQWLDSCPSSIWLLSSSTLNRPFANIAQPNHFSTLTYLGLCCAGFLRASMLVSREFFLFTIIFFSIGIALSGSRTGIVQVFAIALLVEWCYIKRKINIESNLLRVIFPIFIVSVFFVHFISWKFAVSSPRDPMTSLQGGTRLSHLLTMMEAILHRPLLGYGWLQVSKAQQVVSMNRHFSFEQISYSHNIIFDLIIWCGIPAAMIIILTALFFLIKSVWYMDSERSFWLFCFLMGLIIHCLTEYPHAYSYFVIPFGLIVGSLHAKNQSRNNFIINLSYIKIVVLLVVVVVSILIFDYLRAERMIRDARLQSLLLRGHVGVVSKGDLTLLDNLDEYINFINTPARRGMSVREIEGAEKVYYRYPFPPVLLRFALILALNDRIDDSEIILGRLCATHPQPRCDEGRIAWASLQEIYVDINFPKYPDPHLRP